jgi:hypothetical protein
MAVANTLAYYDTSTIVAVKWFIVQAHRQRQNIHQHLEVHFLEYVSPYHDNGQGFLMKLCVVMPPLLLQMNARSAIKVFVLFLSRVEHHVLDTYAAKQLS